MSRKKRLLIYLLALGFTGALLGGLTILGAYVYYAPTLPEVSELKDVQFQVPLRVYSSDGKLVAEYGEQRRVPLTLDEVPDALEQAILAAEDDRFYSHPGIDVIGIARAMWMNLKAGEIVGGGSTITQQVAKNFFLSSEQVLSRKIREAFLALKIEEELSKEEILALYLNKIYLGNRAYGVGAASEIYYGKPVMELNLAQMAMIATLPKAPSRYNPLANPERALQRRAYVLGRMLELDYIGQAEYDEAMAAPVTAEYHGVKVEVDAPYLGELVRADLISRFGEEAYTAGYEVTTTIDSRQQLAARQAVQDALQDYDIRYGYRGPVRQLGAEAQAMADAAWERVLAASDADPDEAAARELDELMTGVAAPARLRPGVVMALDESGAQVYLREYGVVSLGMEGIEWAKPVGPDGNVGATPEVPADVLAIGDVIYLREMPPAEDEPVEQQAMEGEEGSAPVVRWRLAQVPQVQGALVSVSPDNGAVRAMVGGYDYYLSNFNRVTQAQRQPGSSFKPFIYSAALANGFTPATVVNDAPVVFADDKLEDVWRPENDSGRFYGPTRLREALVRSRNLVSIRVLQGMGISNAVNYISGNFGFERDRLPRDLSLALGSAAFSPMQMVSAYAVLANGGYEFEPYFIERIIGPKDEVIYESNPLLVCDDDCRKAEEESLTGGEESTADSITPVVAALPAESVETEGLAAEAQLGGDIVRPKRYAESLQSPQVNYLITDMMRDVIRRGTGVRARELGRDDLAGKTGTTNEYRDAWFSGFNGRVATTVWVGFDDFTSLGRGEYGGRAALPAWIEFMRVALDGMPETGFERPDGLVTVRIDPETGLLASAENPDAIFETFIEGTLPEQEQPGAGRDSQDGTNDEETVEQDLF
ncbi:MAG: penicillin-binding protein 1A [Gammaproteobacteria bacterium]|nr:penicillin-binding protein 1A [Gammaproteobacteria bacterium]